MPELDPVQVEAIVRGIMYVLYAWGTWLLAEELLDVIEKPATSDDDLNDWWMR